MQPQHLAIARFFPRSDGRIPQWKFLHLLPLRLAHSYYFSTCCTALANRFLRIASLAGETALGLLSTAPARPKIQSGKTRGAARTGESTSADTASPSEIHLTARNWPIPSTRNTRLARDRKSPWLIARVLLTWTDSPRQSLDITQQCQGKALRKLERILGLSSPWPLSRSLSWRRRSARSRCARDKFNFARRGHARRDVDGAPSRTSCRVSSPEISMEFTLVKNPNFPLRRCASHDNLCALLWFEARINEKLKWGIRKTNGLEISRNRKEKEREGVQSWWKCRVQHARQCRDAQIVDLSVEIASAYDGDRFLKYQVKYRRLSVISPPSWSAFTVPLGKFAR